jgi:hypothetical protein
LKVRKPARKPNPIAPTRATINNEIVIVTSLGRPGEERRDSPTCTSNSPPGLVPLWSKVKVR